MSTQPAARNSIFSPGHRGRRRRSSVSPAMRTVFANDRASNERFRYSVRGEGGVMKNEEGYEKCRRFFLFFSPFAKLFHFLPLFSPEITNGDEQSNALRTTKYTLLTFLPKVKREKVFELIGGGGGDERREREKRKKQPLSQSPSLSPSVFVGKKKEKTPVLSQPSSFSLLLRNQNQIQNAPRQHHRASTSSSAASPTSTSCSSPRSRSLPSRPCPP